MTDLVVSRILLFANCVWDSDNKGPGGMTAGHYIGNKKIPNILNLRECQKMFAKSKEECSAGAAPLLAVDAVFHESRQTCFLTFSTVIFVF